MPATRTSIEASPKKVMSNDRGVNHLLVAATEGLGHISMQVQEFNVGAAFGGITTTRHRTTSTSS